MLCEYPDTKNGLLLRYPHTTNKRERKILRSAQIGPRSCLLTPT